MRKIHPYTYTCQTLGCKTTKHSDVPLDVPNFCRKCREREIAEAMARTKEAFNNLDKRNAAMKKCYNERAKKKKEAKNV